MHDINNVVLAEHGCERVFLAHIAVNKDDRPVVTMPYTLGYGIEWRLMERHHGMPRLGQSRHYVETDEPGAARDGHHPGVRVARHSPESPPLLAGTARRPRSSAARLLESGRATPAATCGRGARRR